MNRDRRRDRRAGISIPLFSLRSSLSWGIGEMGDIPFFVEWLRSGYQSVLQVLPMNEMAPGETSPYSALSAMAIDPQFISIRLLDDASIVEEACRSELDDVRRAPRVDYPRVRALKDRALRACFDGFYRSEWLGETAKAAALRSFIVGEAWWLDDYSVYRALRRQSGEQPWMAWSAPLRDRDPQALAKARTELATEILFYQYVQWIAASQWQQVRTSTEGVEILGDFPFMVTLDSADVWSRQREFILDASVGTPPDAFSETGQEWGLPPYNWDVAEQNGFEWLRQRARRLASTCDGFRVDHLVGFYRTYVRPLDGRPPYFLPAAEEQQRALGESILRIMIDTGADVSVEDLGTVPAFVRESIARMGLPGYKVLRWEPADPSTYPPLSVAMTGTHDTEPLAVWWESESHEPFTPAVRDAILQRIYGAGSNLVLLPLQDAFGWRDRINQPATISDANWTYVLPWPVDQLAVVPEARERADMLAELSYQTGRW